MDVKEEHIVPQIPAPIRLSDYGGGIFVSIPSRKGVKKAIEKGWVLINGENAKTGDWVNEGDQICLIRTVKNKPDNVRLKYPVVFEDEFLAIVNKPPGVLVSGNRKWTLENSFSNTLRKSTQYDALDYPEPIHRLDYPTTGALLVGKTASAVIALNQLFAQRKIYKSYLAVCIGIPPSTFELNSIIEGKSSFAMGETIASVPSPRFGNLSLLRLHLGTGRRHQLRIQLNELGFPILGDDKYFNDKDLILRGKGLYLHSYKLHFNHPIKGLELALTAKAPRKFFSIFGAEFYHGRV
ncbi:RluA family pseudouridine synthase [Luteibaculum oceani]|uniref:RluA family pseudouridine synthase n=1 Tax=Luteibaculum oceani TaxID=1294296 RepID=A0A5C6V0Q0_9FLAO|nr:RluA family pseudouridine synthase [Luteibaculum oceani]TXC78514.1 RluA family pseudouridine synthase [Luteibaculum oceani]